MPNTVYLRRQNKGKLTKQTNARRQTLNVVEMPLNGYNSLKRGRKQDNMQHCKTKFGDALGTSRERATF